MRGLLFRNLFFGFCFLVATASAFVGAALAAAIAALGAAGTTIFGGFHFLLRRFLRKCREDGNEQRG